MYLHLPGCVMRQFGYMQFAPKDPFDSAPLYMAHIDINAMYDVFLNHLVSGETYPSF